MDTSTTRRSDTRHPHLRRSALLALTTALLVACAQPALQGPPDASGLVAIEHSGLDAARIAPDADLSQYQNLLIDGLHFTDVKLVDPGKGQRSRYRPLSLSDADKQLLNRLFVEQVSKSLNRSGAYGVATQPGAGTLRVVTELVELAPNAPRESDQQFGASVRNDTYSRGAGSMTLESTVSDSVSGRTLAVLRNELTDAEVWGVNNSVTNQAAVQRAFTRWGSTLQRLKAARPGALAPAAAQ